MPLKIQALDKKISVFSPIYHWEWDVETDIFALYDSKKRLIGRGKQQPLILPPQIETGGFFKVKYGKPIMKV